MRSVLGENFVLADRPGVSPYMLAIFGQRGNFSSSTIARVLTYQRVLQAQVSQTNAEREL